MSSRGFDISARAIASCCASPPDRYPAAVVHFSARTGNCSFISSRSTALSVELTVTPPILRFSSTVRSVKILRCSGTSARPERSNRSGGCPVTSAPSRSTDPDTGARSPAIVFSRVVFPAPLGPMRPMTSPAPTCTEAFLSAAIAPYLVVNPDASSNGDQPMVATRTSSPSTIRLIGTAFGGIPFVPS